MGRNIADMRFQDGHYEGEVITNEVFKSCDLRVSPTTFKNCSILNCRFDPRERLSDIRFENCTFSKLGGDGAVLKQVSFVQCNFVDVNFRNGWFTQVKLDGCNFWGNVDFGESFAADSSFTSLNFYGGTNNFERTQFIATELKDIKSALAAPMIFKNSSFEKNTTVESCDFGHADFSKAVLKGKWKDVNLEGANLKDVSFRWANKVNVRYENPWSSTK